MIESSWIFIILSFPTFLRLRNSFLAVSQSYHVWVTSENPGHLPFLQVLECTDNWVRRIFVIVHSSKCRPEVDLDFQGHPSMRALRNCLKWIPRPRECRE